MSWTYDFGVVKDAAALRKHKGVITVSDDVDEDAVRDHVNAVKEAVAVILDSPAFGSNTPARVQASGQANEGHDPREQDVTEDGRVMMPTAPESITLTITHYMG